VWVLYCDLICLDYDGNILDACTFALLAALKNGGSGLTGAKLQDCMSRAVTRHKEVKKLMDEVIKSMKPK
ncbi:exosome component 8, partial [Homo sapiens]